MLTYETLVSGDAVRKWEGNVNEVRTECVPQPISL